MKQDKEVAGLGIIPEAWGIMRIKDIGKLVLGKMLDEKAKEGYDLRPYLKSKNVGWFEPRLDEISEMYFSRSEMQSLRLRKGDLVFSEGGEVGKTLFWSDDIPECYIQNSVQKLTTYKDYESRYYLYVSFSLGEFGFYKSIVNQVSIMHLTHEKLERVQVPIPPLSEQKAIANYLDEKCGKIDEQVKLLEKKVEAYKNLKRSIINETVTRGLDKNVKLKDSGVDWIGMVPEGWEVKRLESCIYEVVVKNNPVRTTNLLSLIKDVGVIPYSEKGLVGNKEKLDYSEYKVAYPNTIVANSMNILIGSVGLCNYEGCVSPVYYVFKTNALGNIKYINYLFSTRAFQRELRKYANGILEIRLRVSASDILKCEVPLPCVEEQKAIVNYLDEKCSKIGKAIDLVEKQIDAYKRLKRSLINEVVTGKRRVA